MQRSSLIINSLYGFMVKTLQKPAIFTHSTNIHKTVFYYSITNKILRIFQFIFYFGGLKIQNKYCPLGKIVTQEKLFFQMLLYHAHTFYFVV